jgi:uncharacterized protein
MLLSPLFVKCKTDAGTPFVYDPATNEIVRVNETVYAILDDYHVLSTEELVIKYKSLGAQAVLDAVVALDTLQASGVLCDEEPRLALVPEKMNCKGKQQSFDDFHAERRGVLILELTQQCNLRCSYCVYGSFYDRYRKHNPTKMSHEAAYAAVDDFLDHLEDGGFISFYGGEAFLEFELLKDIVHYAEASAAKKGIDNLGFSVTSNGTLLTDEKIKFIVDHKFAVSVSIDGDRDTHDRYRIFRNERDPDQRIGSFDLIMRNLKRMHERFPEFSCSLSITLTATTDYEATNEYLKELGDSFIPKVHFVQTIPDQGDRSTWEGCAGPRLTCGERSNGSAGTVQDPVQLGVPSNSKSTVDFCNWTSKDSLPGLQQFFDLFAECDDVEALRKEYPLYVAILEDQRGGMHRRPVTRNAHDVFATRCYLGASRSFLSATGNLYPCERVETSDTFRIGDAHQGASMARVNRLSHIFRLMGDCGNCISNKLCGQCSASIREKNGQFDAVSFQRGCRETIAGIGRGLQRYCTLMEQNADAFNELIPPWEEKSWVNKTSPIPTQQQLAVRQRFQELAVEAAPDWL